MVVSVYHRPQPRNPVLVARVFPSRIEVVKEGTGDLVKRTLLPLGPPYDVAAVKHIGHLSYFSIRRENADDSGA